MLNPYRMQPVGQFGLNVKAAAARAGIDTQSELAERLHKRKGQVSSWLSAEWPNLELKTLFAFAKVLGVPIESLCAGMDEEYDAMVIRACPDKDQLLLLWPELSDAQRRALVTIARTFTNKLDSL